MTVIRKTIIALAIAVLFVSLIVGIMFYYGGKVSADDSKIASLNSQAATKSSEMADLTSQIAHFNSEVANLSTCLKVSEVKNGTSPSQPVYFNGVLAYNALSINGTVVNTGNLTAYDAGLTVTAYSADGTLEINMTVPLIGGDLLYFPSDPYISSDVLYYGVDYATQAYANKLNNWYGDTATLNLGNLGGGQTAPVDIEIIHEGTVANWTVTTVWINSS